jgi:3'-phosphoadenosine 5'-phosphosulfate sulfotransferase (PAPS reductase)/FAD synthetase
MGDTPRQVRHICGLSGGKDSTALALYMRDRVPEMEYVFCDTGRELPETYEYLGRVEAYLGKPITTLNATQSFDHWLKVFDGYLPSPRARWCTKLLKLKPFEAYVGDEPVISYVGIRADENRTGLISGKPNLTTVYPLKEGGIDLAGVMRILEDSGIGLPPYLSWGRSHSGCFFCFFQSKHEWLQLLKRYPDKFAEAEAYETVHPATGTRFTWMDDMPLSRLRDPEVQEQIVQEHRAAEERRRERRRGSGLLVQSLGGLALDRTDNRACLICQL